MLMSMYTYFLGFDIQNLGSSSYSSLSINLFDFKAIDGLPIALSKRIENFGSANQLAEKLATEKSIFHKNCASRYNKSKLARHEEKSDKTSEVKDTPRSSRRSLVAKNFIDKCFFCDDIKDTDTLHDCQTLYLDMRIRKIAQDMSDSKLLSKLAEGDMVATEAKYHRSCLIDLYNKYRDFKRRKFTDEYQDEFAKG